MNKIIFKQFEKDKLVAIANPKHRLSGRMGHVVMSFVKGTLAGKTLVSIGKLGHITLENWELGEVNVVLGEPKINISNPVEHPCDTGYTIKGKGKYSDIS